MVEAPKGKELKGDLERIASQKAEGYCEPPLVPSYDAKLALTWEELQAELVMVEHHPQKGPILAVVTRARMCEKHTFDEGGVLSIPTQ